MPLTIKPNQAYITGAPSDPPCIEIMGQKWPIPKLAPKQNEVVVPILLEMVPHVIKGMNATEEVNGKTVKIDPIQSLAKTLSKENLHDLYTCVYMALTRAHPQLTRDEFDSECELGPLEVIEQIFTVADQTGVIKLKKPTPTENAAALMFGKSVQGEGQAASPQTGAQ